MKWGGPASGAGIKLSLPALRMRGEAGRGGEGEEGEGGESGDDWENEESEDDLDGDSEVIFFGEEGFGDEGDYDDVEIGDRDIFVLHYESGAVRVWGEPSRRGSAGEDAPGERAKGVKDGC